MVRNQAKRQVYAGYYYQGLLCSGRIFYSGEVENPDYYHGTHQDYARDGFGEYHESGAWSYIGFWKNETMNGFGRYTNKHTHETFTGVFSNNQIQGWG